ncbi:MAG: transposase [Ignavibacteriales bacterium]|nr:transposase [Ignavibacteriales bacterium]
MFTNKISGYKKKSNSSLTTTENYDHYIALDWSERNMAIARIGKTDIEPKTIDVPSDLKELKIYLTNLKGNKILTIEETTTSQWLYVELYDYVEKIFICDPYRNRLLSDGPKTDRIDAGKLCKLLKNGMMKEVYHSTNELYELRKLVSYYDDEVKAGVRLLNQKSALYRAENKSWKKKEELEGSRVNKFIVEQLDEKIESYQEKKKRYEEEFSKISKKNKVIRSLQSIPGLGPISSVTILSIVIDGKRFRSSNHYLVYCGLVKHDKLSGGRSYGKRIPRYSRRLKGVYKSAAVRVTSTENPLREYYEYLLKEKKFAEHNAKHAVARYIAKISLGIIKSGEKYKPYKWRDNKKEREAA